MFEMPPDAVRINGNENPAGPCPEAADAIHSVVQNGGRYGFMETFGLAQTAAEIEGVKPDSIMVFAGSSDPLHRTVMAFCSPTKSFVTGDPGYEAGKGAAQFLGAKIFEIPLTKTYAHDVRAMVKADSNAGIIYICNPNNPSGTLTPREDIEWALANKPAGSILLLDEAYIHISQAWENRGCDLVAAGKDVIILRTFSKLYGMAGLRAGFAMGRPDLLQKLQPYGSGMMPVTGMVGATASLKAKTLVADRRKLMKDIREDVFGFLDQRKLTYVRSDSNCFMLDTKRPAQDFMKAMAAEKVFVGRSWPAWPTHSRITVGSWDDMKKFKAAVAKVMA
jgi:histidinol-phosphate/aromatic aminotransferase/cobyric acid decarboxylase-like protein